MIRPLHQPYPKIRASITLAYLREQRMRDLLSRRGACTHYDRVTCGINHMRIVSALEVVASRVQRTYDRDDPPGVKRGIGIHH